MLRAQLLEEGYDATGAVSTAAALSYPPSEPGREPVSLIVLDQDTAATSDSLSLAALKSLHRQARLLLLARAATSPPPGPWDRVLRRPVTIGETVAAVKEIAPIPEGSPASEG